LLFCFLRAAGNCGFSTADNPLKAFSASEAFMAGIPGVPGGGLDQAALLKMYKWSDAEKAALTQPSVAAAAADPNGANPSLGNGFNPGLSAYTPPASPLLNLGQTDPAAPQSKDPAEAKKKELEEVVHDQIFKVAPPKAPDLRHFYDPNYKKPRDVGTEQYQSLGETPEEQKARQEAEVASRKAAPPSVNASQLQLANGGVPG
jgi:hypothetical protein